MLKIKSVNFDQQEFGTHTLVQSYPEQLEWVIGRYATCDLVLSAQEVSRVHGRIFYQDGTYYFVDEGSTSGSSLNGEVIAANDKRSLSKRDLLQIGETYLHIEEIEPPSFAPSDGATGLPRSLTPGVADQPWTGDLSMRCCRIIDETADAKTFCFVADPPMLFSYKPGQFVNLEVEIEGKPVLRCYSISSSPSRPYHLDLTVKREPSPPGRPDIPPGLVSNWLHDSLKVGGRVKLIGPPLGQFSCLPNPPSKMLMISAGSGITPMMSMSRWVQDTLADCDVVFLHSARNPGDLIFGAELATMSAQMPNFHLAATMTQSSSRHPWMGLTGRLSQAMLRLVVPDLMERHVYVCGPNGFVQAVKSLLEAENFPMSQYKEESFGGAKVAAPPQSEPKTTMPAQTTVPATSNGKGMPPAANGGRKVAPPPAAMPAPPSAPSNGKGSAQPAKTGPGVNFAKSGKDVPADGNSSVLELAEQEGISIRSACRVGACGACKVLVRQGQVEYSGQPMALSAADQEAGYILSCIARPVDALVVDA
ncbi:MAG: FHA domain-containing protein [Leptolyngbyaceae cyanobacterium CRU_2_3]|nr:FHA domain-containing protein [Leptolyngbyaceae cyanobacterium CRU_2_3]